MVQSRLRSSTPPEGLTWADFTGSVAAIYGANASGKSQLLDALRYLVNAVGQSATTWSERKTIPRSPFRLDETSPDAPSEYVLDFVHEEVRYEYGFVVSKDAVLEEWLFYYPTGRKRILFERDEAGPTFGRALKGGEARIRETLKKRELVLSKGALLGYRQLATIAELITDRITVARFGDSDREERLRALMRDVLESRFDLEDLRTMLKVADVGIADAGVTSNETDAQTSKVVRAVLEATTSGNSVDEDVFQHILMEFYGRALMFEHAGAGNQHYKLPSQLQSSGTLTWLSLAAPAVETVRNGGVFIVDELDSSLHPQLAQVMIQLFKDHTSNPKHAQLVFTTHDTYFLSPRSRITLSPDEVVFVEKDRAGVSSVFTLADFPNRKDENHAARYLSGRYGAVPTVAPSFLAGIVERHSHEDANKRVGAFGDARG